MVDEVPDFRQWMRWRRRAPVACALVVTVCLVAVTLAARELRPATLAAYDRTSQLTELGSRLNATGRRRFSGSISRRPPMRDAS